MDDAIHYENPTIITYGSVRELTLGNGSSSQFDSTTEQCGPLSGGRQSNTPSHVTCVIGG